MHTIEIQIPQEGRRRGRSSDEFILKDIAARIEQGFATDADAFSYGLSANLSQRHQPSGQTQPYLRAYQA